MSIKSEVLVLYDFTKVLFRDNDPLLKDDHIILLSDITFTEDRSIQNYKVSQDGSNNDKYSIRNIT